MKPGFVAAAFFLTIHSAAQAALITVVNNDFEAVDPAPAIVIPGVGDVWYGAPGFGYTRGRRDV